MKRAINAERFNDFLRDARLNLNPCDQVIFIYEHHAAHRNPENPGSSTEPKKLPPHSHTQFSTCTVCKCCSAVSAVSPPRNALAGIDLRRLIYRAALMLKKLRAEKPQARNAKSLLF